MTMTILSCARSRSRNPLAHPSNHLCCNSIRTGHVRRFSLTRDMLLHLTVECRSILHFIVFTNLLFWRTLHVVSQPDLRGASFSIVHHGKWSGVESFHVISFSTTNLPMRRNCINIVSVLDYKGVIF